MSKETLDTMLDGLGTGVEKCSGERTLMSILIFYVCVCVCMCVCVCGAGRIRDQLGAMGEWASDINSNE